MDKVLKLIAVALVAMLVIATPVSNGFAKNKELTDDQVARFLHKLTKSKYLTIEGRLFTNFNVDLSKGEPKEASFEIQRLYFTIKSQIVKWLRVRTTFDVIRYTQDAKGEDPLFGFVKYAYFDYIPIKQLTLRFGQQQQPWVDMWNKINGYRFVAKAYQDYFKSQSSAELGFSVRGKFFDKRFHFDVGIFNAVGYRKDDSGRPFEDLLFLVKLAYMPLAHTGGAGKGLGIHAFFSHVQNKESDGSTERRMQFGGGLSFVHKYVRVGGEMIVQQSRNGGTKRKYYIGGYLSGHYKGWAIFGQAGANIDKNQADHETYLHFVVGASYSPIKYFSIALDYQQDYHTRFKSDISQKVFIHTLVKY